VPGTTATTGAGLLAAALARVDLMQGSTLGITGLMGFLVALSLRALVNAVLSLFTAELKEFTAELTDPNRPFTDDPKSEVTAPKADFTAPIIGFNTPPMASTAPLTAPLIAPVMVDINPLSALMAALMIAPGILAKADKILPMPVAMLLMLLSCSP
jgi:hypothetical protein